MDRRSISMFLDEEGSWCFCVGACCCCCSMGHDQLWLLAEKRQRERRDIRDTTTRSTTPPIPEEPEDADSDTGYVSGDSPSPPERKQHPAAAIHRQHAPPARSDTRTSTGFREPPVTWHHEGPAIAIGGAQYPGAAQTPYAHPAVYSATNAFQCDKICRACCKKHASLVCRPDWLTMHSALVITASASLTSDKLCVWLMSFLHVLQWLVGQTA